MIKWKIKPLLYQHLFPQIFEYVDKTPYMIVSYIFILFKSRTITKLTFRK